jgi:hypothetical protein
MGATLYLHLLPQLAVAVAVAGVVVLPRIGTEIMGVLVAGPLRLVLPERAPLVKEIMVERDYL